MEKPAGSGGGGTKNGALSTEECKDKDAAGKCLEKAVPKDLPQGKPAKSG